MTAERYEGPIPPGHGEGNPDVIDPSEPVPVCPVCRGKVRGWTHPDRRVYTCDLHGEVQPTWIDGT